MRASLAVLSELSPMPNGRRIAVLGDMLELGEMAEELHKNVGEFVAKSKTDVLVCYGENSRFIKESADNLGFKNSIFFTEKLQIINYLKENIKKNDLILFKASRGMKLEEIIEEIYKI